MRFYYSLTVLFTLTLISPNTICAKESPSISHIITIGTAEKSISPDTASWSGVIEISQDSTNVVKIKGQMVAARDKVIKYLEDRNIPQSSIQFSPAQINPLYQHTDKTTKLRGYNIRQNFQVHLDDIDLITKLAHDSFDLFSGNILFHSQPVVYNLKNLNSTQLELLALATQQAHQKADAIAKSEGKKVSKVLNIEEIYDGPSGTNLDYGMAAKISPSDTSGITKQVLVRVKATYGIE